MNEFGGCIAFATTHPHMCVPTATAPMSLARPSSSTPKVAFAAVEVRAYPRTLGDNPSVSSGPPVSLSWHHDKESSGCCTVDEWEAQRHLARRTKEEFRVPAAVRFAWMRDAGISTAQVMEAVLRIDQERKRRRASICKGPLQDRRDEQAEQVKRRLERLRGRERSGALYDQWRAAQDCGGCDGLQDQLQEMTIRERRKPPAGKPPRRRRVTLDLGMVRPLLEKPLLLRRPSDPVSL